MATTVATSGFGTILKIGNGATAEVFTAVSEVVNITGPGESLETIDATHMQSPSNYREFIPSLLDSGEVTLDLNFLPGTAGQTVIRTALTGRTKKNWKLVFTDSALTTYKFAGYVTAFEPSAQIDDKLSASCTIKVTGPVTLSS